ncbi:UNVERIFIED_CONTAM: hypothetical protein FKN15_048765 [Acipenser sinensis]
MGWYLCTDGLEGFSLIDAPSFLKVVRKADLLLFSLKIKEGFSLIDAPSFLKVVRKADLLLFSLKIKNESRMFRMQFGGGSREQAVEHCGSAVLTLQQYVTVKSQDTGQPAQGSLLGESKLSLPLAYRHSTLPSEELGPFLRLCLLDQSFPAFVEQVEKELRKIANE